MSTIIACLSCQSLAKIQSRRIPNLPSELCKDASVLWTVTFYLLVALPSSLEMTAFFSGRSWDEDCCFENVCICICFVLGCGRLPTSITTASCLTILT
jgi:hypothetical protein